ncbi:DNA-binding transcriptional regulator, LacI/PurR family [Rhodococcus triatomae]|uniref:DNA-binding transcriptional regulator, LacI/PurR family n=1 Tax=Rhodococcus triatomae TaxID=300028 RepID=A0A1G8BGD1_9NOCA|nr:DNA-binding transcriptional regulator, LacI/PurR family [Rhodococcus triatomae]
MSNAYNRPDQLSSELRERVLLAAKRRGYPGPDPVARSLRTRKAGAVGLLLTEDLSYSFRDPAAMSFLAGLAESCEVAGQGLLLIPAGPGTGSGGADPAAVVHQAAVDGFVVYSVADDDPYLAAVRERHLPIVVCDQPRGISDAALIVIDDSAATGKVTEYLLGLGHRRFGVLAMRLGRERADGPAAAERLRSPHFHVQRERIAGVQDTLAAAGVSPATVIERYDHTVAAGASAAAQALSIDPEITALVCTSDVLALGALDHARQAGIDVPGRLSVTGFDGVEAATRAGLTTVGQPQEEKGRRAGALLMSSARSGVAGIETLDTELVVGTTTGTAPAADPNRRGR